MYKKSTCILFLGISLFLQSAYANTIVTRKELPILHGNPNQIIGWKWPNSKSEGLWPVPSFATIPTINNFNGGYNDLLPYILQAPDQDEAGSCLFMTLTGIVEYWMSYLHDIPATLEGPTDFSERYLMNVSKYSRYKQSVRNWRTDMIYIVNNVGHKIYRNQDYRFTKDWFFDNGPTPATPNAPGAIYGTYYNWIDELKLLDEVHPISTPQFRRDILFADSHQNQWAVDVAPNDLVEKIKKALVEKKAPVQIIYNHYRYWHSVLIVGFNDNETHDCPFLSEVKPTTDLWAKELEDKANQTSDPSEKKKLLAEAKKERDYGNRIQNIFTRIGCSKHGYFYVRDSIYPNPDEPLYDYNLNDHGEETHYNKKVILYEYEYEYEYEWVRALGNHAVQILIE